MGNNVTRDELCLIPPQIKQKRPLDLYRSDFDLLGRSVRELQQDFFPDSNSLEVNLFLKPSLNAPDPSVESFTRAHVAFDDEDKVQVGGNLGVEVAYKTLRIRAVADAGSTTGALPGLQFVAEQNTDVGIHWFVEGASQSSRIGGGISYYHNFINFGAFSRNIHSENKDTPREGLLWSTFRWPGLMLGLQTPLRLEPSGVHPNTQGTDLALCVFDPNSTVADRPKFEVALIAREMGKSFTLSYFQHFVLRRNIYNPLEEHHIKQIVNYVDIGTQASIHRGENKADIGVSASWQMNKNNMIKAKVDNRRLSLCYVFKSWMQPSIAASFTGKYDFRTQSAGLGLVLTLSTVFGGDYERAEDGGVNSVRYQAERAAEVKRYERIDQGPRAQHHQQPQQPVGQGGNAYVSGQQKR